MQKIRRVWVDTETTKLDIWRRAWDVALIVRDPSSSQDDEYQWFVHPIDIELERADPVALDIGGFWERHPHGVELDNWGARDALLHGALSLLGKLDMRQLAPARNVRRARHIARDVFDLTAHKSQIYGSNPSFDMLTFEHMLSEEGLKPQWYYHPNDVPNLIEGWTYGRASVGRALRLPRARKSEDWCRVVGIDPDNYERHSALGDCRLFRDAFDAMFDSERP